MRVALSSLAKFWIDNNGKVSEALSAETYENPEDAKVIRGYLRLVSSYFVNSARLFEAGLISRKLLRLLIAHPGLNVFYEVVVPMSLTKNPHHNSGTYVHLLKRIAKRHGDGKIYYQP
jgi:hypothetical protein